jgi:Initiator Replication protein
LTSFPPMSILLLMNLPRPRSTATPSIKTPQELVHIKHKITLRQYKYWVLILKSYRESYESDIKASDGGFRYMPMQRLADHLGYEPNKTELRADFEALRKEAIIYNVLGKDGKAAQRGSGFISEWEVSSNWVGYKLPDFLVKCVERLDLKNAIFQQLNWDIFNSFSGKYEAILYKLCKDYVGVQRTPHMAIGVFREYMGLRDKEYSAFKDLNKYIISGPIRKINESKLADIEIEVDFSKESRRVVGLQFFVKRKFQMDLGFGDDPAFASARVTVSLAQQQKYLKEKSADEIALALERANEYADEQEKKGSAVNFGALYQTAITNGWGTEQKEKLEAEARRIEMKLKAERVKEAEKQRDVQVEQNRDLLRKAAMVRFASLDATVQANLINEFGNSLKGFPLMTFKKTGISSAMLAPTFANWLVDSFQVASS